MRKQIVSSLITLIGLGGLHAQSVYFADGYHGGVFGHYPKWQTAFMMDKLKEYPGWRINLELEPETFDSVKVWVPDTYREFQQFLAKEDGRLIEFTNPTYSQPYCYNISGESLIRQFSYGMNLLRVHFPTLSFHTYAVEEPCFTSALPQILRLFGFRYAVLKNPDTCYGGYMVAYGDDLVNWIGPDNTQMLTIPPIHFSSINHFIKLKLIHIAGFWLCYIWHINLLSIFYCSIFSFIQILSNYLFYNVFPPPTYAPSSPDTSLMVSFYLHVHTAPISAVLSVLPFPHYLHC